MTLDVALPEECEGGTPPRRTYWGIHVAVVFLLCDGGIFTQYPMAFTGPECSP
jgi:hypothetical protein